MSGYVYAYEGSGTITGASDDIGSGSTVTGDLIAPDGTQTVVDVDASGTDWSFAIDASVSGLWQYRVQVDGLVVEEGSYYVSPSSFTSGS